jgi:hypothetical protein
MFKKTLQYFGAAVASAFATASMAQTDYSAISGAADWSDVIPVVLGVMGAAALLYVAFKGGKIGLRAIKGA